MLSPELRRPPSRRARRSSRTRRRPVLRLRQRRRQRRGDRRCCRRRPTTKRRRPSPTRTPTWCCGGLRRRRPELRLRQALPLPGPRGGAPGHMTRINLDADAAAPGDAAGHAGRDRQAAADHRRLDLGSVGPAAALHRRDRRRRRRMRRRRTTRPRSRTSRPRSAAAATRASRTTTTATCGSPRTSAARRKAGTTAKRRTASCSASSRRAGRPQRTGKLQALQVLDGGATGEPRPRRTALNSPDQVALHTYGSTFGTKWITIHDTADEQRAVQRQRGRDGPGRDAVQAPGERRVPAGLALPRVLLRRDRRHERDQPGERGLGGWTAASSS